MSARSVSPGGALLRASRVFEIPPPLPRPSGDLSSTAIFNSDSATLPHPTHLSITTPQSSLKRGDWGFKRPLPLRSTTRTSTPYIRVKDIDTFEHITEFSSAADHTLTLQKWQEMGVPLSTPVKSSSISGTNFPSAAQASGKTVFEDKYDTIAPADGIEPGKDDVRWKFKGPWLAGLNEGEFNTYVSKEVRKRKDDFRKFLRNTCAIETTQTQHRAASEQGDDIPPAVQSSDVTDDQLTEYIKDLRKDRIKLYKHIRSFLDLPASPNVSAISLDQLDGFDAIFSTVQNQFQKGNTSDSPYADSGPPKTHPSAGLAYSRSSSHLFNHPIYGPQKNKPPVQARVVMPRAAATGNFAPVLGVGGFVTNVPAGADTPFNLNNMGKGGKRPASQIPGLMNVEPEKVGGSKTWVHPKHARIDPKGRVILNVVTADPEAVAVHEGTVGDIPTEHKRPAPFSAPNPVAVLSSFSSGYGLNPRNLGKREDRRMVREDNDALKELEGLVQSRGKGKAE
jgi:hypothetical protein